MVLADYRIDHATVAWHSLAEIQSIFADFGLESEYGGEHESLPTHMAILGFEDGSYVELISKRADEAAPFWDDAMDNDRGPCAWAVGVPDIESAVDRLREAGVAVDGPDSYSREPTDEERAEWYLAVLGDGDPGETLPFLIQDVTPREYRIEPTPAVRETELIGVSTVVVAVADVDAVAETFERAFGVDEWTTAEAHDGPFAGTVTSAPDVPAMLLEPADESPVSDRLDRFGRGPCALCFETADLVASRDRFDGLDAVPLGDRTVHVADPDGHGGLAYVGVATS